VISFLIYIFHFYEDDNFSKRLIIIGLLLFRRQQITTDTASSFTFCGTEVPETLTLNATLVTLTFTSDYAVTEMGFEIEFKVQVHSSSAETTTGLTSIAFYYA